MLANLEGSTLVKRLKAASRQQYAIAGRINDRIGDIFGDPATLPTKILKPNDSGLTPLGVEVAKKMNEVAIKETPAPLHALYTNLAQQEEESIQKISYIMDDMDAYFDRRRLVRFKVVLDDMRKKDVIGSLRQLSR